MTTFSVIQVTWQSHQTDLMRIREQVFINEQQVPIALEWDDQDETATHLLAFAIDLDSDKAIACARILPDGHIGRMAVLKDFRGLGVGSAVLAHAINLCRVLGVHVINISAQKHALSFYKRVGFVVTSAEYMDAGIAHYNMNLIVSD